MLGGFIVSAGQTPSKVRLCPGVGTQGRRSPIALLGAAAAVDCWGLLVEIPDFVFPCCRRKNSLTGGANSMLPQERGKNVAAIWRKALTP